MTTRIVKDRKLSNEAVKKMLKIVGLDNRCKKLEKKLSELELVELNGRFLDEQNKELAILIQENDEIFRTISKSHPEAIERLAKIRIVEKAKEYDIDVDKYFKFKGYQDTLDEEEFAKKQEEIAQYTVDMPPLTNEERLKRKRDNEKGISKTISNETELEFEDEESESTEKRNIIINGGEIYLEN